METDIQDDTAIAECYWSALKHSPSDFCNDTLKIVIRDSRIAHAQWIMRAGEQNETVTLSTVSEKLRGSGGNPRIEICVEHDGAAHQLRAQAANEQRLDEQRMRRRFQHAVEAYSMNHHYHHGAARLADQQTIWGYADVDAQMKLLASDDVFRQLLSDAFGDLGIQLPFRFEWTDSVARSGIAMNGLYFRVNAQPDGFRLSVRRDRRTRELSAREWTIAAELAQGKTYKEIGLAVGVAPSTASTHVYNLMSKLGFTRRSQLVQWFGDRVDTPRQGDPPVEFDSSS